MTEFEKKMADFYQRAKNSLPEVPVMKPFVVTVDEQKTEPTPFAELPNDIKILRREPQVLGPKPPGLTSVTPNKVIMTGGTTVTIVGTNFVSGATVKIAGLDATSVVFVNDTKLTCITPSDGLGFVNVEVTNPSGQQVSDATLLQYVNFPDNFVVSGQQSVQGYQGCAGGPIYTYQITARLGNVDFVPPAGVIVYGWFALVQDAGSCGLGPTPFAVKFDHTTGATVNLEMFFAIKAVTPGSYGFASGFMAMYASSDGSLGSRYPTYGDPVNQPSSFRIDIRGDGPLPTGAGDRFQWLDTAWPSDGHNSNFGWLSGAAHTIKIGKVTPDGTLITTYNGTATLSYVWDNPGFGLLGISLPATITFVSGVATLGIVVNYTYENAQHSQAFAQFHFRAVDGAVSGFSPPGSCLNHL